MKKLRSILIACTLTVLCFGAITYTACKKDKCDSTTCLNGGSCLDGVCTCPTPYSGTRCETDACANIVCGNGGMCVSGQCKCANGYEGERCEIVNRFIGNYTAYDSCTQSNRNYVVVLNIRTSGEPSLKMYGIIDPSTPLYANISGDGNSFTIVSTSYNGYSYSGGGYYDNGKIRIGYTVDYTTFSYSCSGTWVKE
jgi:hypothetical protein